MKLHFLLFIFFSVAVNLSAAGQNTAPYWSLTGNSTATAISKLGTTTAIDLRLYANNAERMRILSSNGYVGIGTTAPTERLHVSGPAGVHALRVQVAGNTKLLVASNGGTACGGSVVPPANGLYVAGNVGIGTAVPTARLMVNSAGTTPLLLQVAGKTTLYAAGNGGLSVGNGDLPPANGLNVAGGTIFRDKVSIFGGGLNLWNSGIEVQNTEPQGIGVFARGAEEGGYGVWGDCVNDAGIGVHGSGTRGVEGIGNAYGVYGSGLAQGSVGVYGTGAGYGILGESGATGVEGHGGSYGVFAKATNTGSSGIYASGVGYGLYAKSSGDEDTATGVYGEGIVGVHGKSSVGGYTSMGVYGEGVQGVSGKGLYGLYGVGAAYGVYALVTDRGGWAGHFQGDVRATSFYATSDRNLQENIAGLNNAMALVKKLKPKTYSFKQNGAFSSLNLPTGTQYGLIAQEVENVLPTLVANKTSDLGQTVAAAKDMHSLGVTYKSINYTQLIPIVIKAMQEQEAKLEALKREADRVAILEKKNTELEARLQKLEALVGGRNTGLTVTPVSLSQAVRNPAQGTTRISYSLPQGSRGQLLLTDAAGKTIKAVSLNNSGTLNINTAGLSSGIYNYSLMVDGTVADTKRLTIVH